MDAGHRDLGPRREHWLRALADRARPSDNGGTLTGAGGGADCRFFPMCGSFSAYTVSGTHDAVRVALNGATQGGRTWTLTGTLSDGASRMSGTGSGSEFGPSRWELQKRP